MWVSNITGNLGKDAETKDVNGQTVCEFSVAQTDTYRGEKTTTWFGCSLWGQKRIDAIQRFLVKGQKVNVIGSTRTREYNGKTYHDIRVLEIDPFCGGKRDGTGSSSGGRAEPAPGGGSDEYGNAGSADDDIPF